MADAPSRGRGFGVAAGLDPEVAEPVARRCTEYGYSSLWSNDHPMASGLETLAAFAAECSPKPWPFARVVKPWRKIRVRFSGGIPTPLSCTMKSTRPGVGDGASRTVTRLSEAPASSQAYFALRIRLTST